MNHIYRVVFNRALGIYQVASELTRRQGKRSGTVSSGFSSAASSVVAASLLALTFETAWAGGDGGAGGCHPYPPYTAGAGWSDGWHAAGNFAGGTGGAGSATCGAGGNGGNPGTVVTSTASTVIFSYDRIGFNGAAGGGTAAGGGGGGEGAKLNSQDVESLIINAGVTVQGGNGGAGNGVSGGNPGGGGGGGLVTKGTNSPYLTITNHGMIVGGNGGSGKAGGLGGNGGWGGGFLELTGGGTGGVFPGYGSHHRRSPTITNAQGGAAIVGVPGQKMHVINEGAGFIRGGMSADGVTRAFSVIFGSATGTGQNILELRNAPERIEGQVWALEATGDILRLGGVRTDDEKKAWEQDYLLNVSHLVSSYHSTAKFLGFEKFEKTDDNVWRLVNFTSAATPWFISGGMLLINENGSLGATNQVLTLSNGGALGVGNPTTIPRNIALATAGGRLRSVTTTGTGVAFSGVISGAGDLTIDSLDPSFINRIVLSGTNTYTGGTFVDNATLSVTQDANLGRTTNPGMVSLTNGGELELAGVSAFGTSRQLYLDEGQGRVTVLNSGQTLTWNGQVTGSGQLQKSGPGTLVLSNGTNTYSGSTTINEGTLSVSQDSNLGDSTGKLIFDGETILPTLKITAGFDMNRTITSKGPGGVISVEGSDLTVTSSGIIDGAGVLGKRGDGTLLLNALNTYEGGTAIAEGTLSISRDENLGQAGKEVGIASSNGTATLKITGVDPNSDFTSTSRPISLTSSGGIIELVEAGRELTLEGVISGDNTTKLTLKGGGKFILTGNNTHTGQLIVDALGGVQVGDGTTIGSLATNDVVTNTAAGLGFSHSNAQEYAGVISGTGGVQKSGVGTLTLSGTNSYSGGTTIKAGTLSVSQDSNLGNSTGKLTFDGATLAPTLKVTGTAGTPTSTALNRAITLKDSGGVMDIDSLVTLNSSSVIDGAGGLEKAGTGSLRLSGTNSYEGGTTIASGRLYVGRDENLGESRTRVNIGGASSSGRLLIEGSLLSTWDRPITLLGSQMNGFDVNQSGHTVTSTAVIDGTGGLYKHSTGKLVLDATNEYEGGTRITDGILSISRDENLGKAGTQVRISATGTSPVLQITGTDPDFTSTSRPISLSASNGAIELMQAGRELTLSGVISGGNTANLTLKGDGKFILTGANTHTGQLIVDAVGGMQVGDGGTTGSLASSDIVTNTVAGVGFSHSNAQEYAGVISGVGGVQKSGVGTLTLSGTNTYQGGTTINEGTLSVSQNASLGNSAGKLNFNGIALAPTLKITGTDFTALGRAITLNGGGGVIDVQESNLTVNSSGVIDGAGGLEKAGAGTLVLSGTNTYQGGTKAAGGTVSISKDSNLGQAGTALALDDATLKVTGTTAFTSNRALSLGADDGAISVLDAGQTLTWSGQVSGEGGLLKQGAGTLVLTAANTYEGGTLISGGGVLEVSGDAMLGDADGGITLDDGTLAITDAAYDTTGRDIRIEAGDGVLDTRNAGATYTVNGSISGSGDLTVEGVRQLIVAGTNLATGQLIVNSAGGVQLGNGGATGNWLGDVALNTTAGLTLRHTGNQTLSGIVSGIGKVEQKGSGTVTLSGVNTYQGGTTIGGGGTLRVSFDHNLGQANQAVTLNNGTLQIQGTPFTSTDRRLHLNSAAASGNVVDIGAGTTQFNGVIDGVGELNKIGAGKMELTAVNIYQGGTRVSGGGTVSIFQDRNLGQAETMVSLDNATLEVTGTTAFTADRVLNLGSGHGRVDVQEAAQVFTWDGSISGDGQLRKRGAGTLVLAGTNNTYGATTVIDGELQISSDANLSSSNQTVTIEGGTLAYRDAAASASQVLDRTLVLTAATQARLEVDLGDADKVLRLTRGTGGTARLITDGVGRLVLEGWATHTGGTTINNLGGLQVDAGGSITALSSVGGVVNNTWLGFNRNADLVVSNVISGTGQVEHMSDRMLTLSGINTYQGGTVISGGGTVRVTHDYNLGQNTGAVTFNNGRLQIMGTALTSMGRQLHLNSATAGGNVVEIAAGGTTQFNGVIDGEGRLDKTGQGTMVLAGLNDYQGGTRVAGGTVSISQDGNLGRADTLAAKTVTFDGGRLAFHDLNPGATRTLDRRFVLDQATTLDVNLNGTAGNTLVLQDETAGANRQVVSGAGALTVTGTGRVVLAGSALHAGGTTVDNAGGLQVGDGGTRGVLTGDVATQTWLGFNRSDTQTFTGRISGVGAVEQMAASTLVLDNDANNYSGGTRITGGGTIRAAKNSNLGAASGELRLNDGTLELGSADFTAMNRAVWVGAGGGVLDLAATDTTLTLDGVVSGSGDLALRGTGTVIMSATNTYDGALTVANTKGLQLGVGGATGSLAGDIQVDTSLTWLHGTDQQYAGVLSGAGALAQQGAGTLTLSGDSSGFTGSTQVASGALRLDHANLGGSSASVLANATLAGVGTIGSGAAGPDPSTVHIAAGARLAPGGVNTLGTLAVAGHLSLDDAALVQIRLGNAGLERNVPGVNDRIHVDGDLRLGGELHLLAAPTGQGTPGKGYYRLITYAGELTEGEFEVVDSPTIPDATSLTILTDQANVVDLYIANDELQIWKGGSGVWNETDTDWLNDSGNTKVRWAGKTAVFADDADGDLGGVVAINDDITAWDLQFAKPDYRLNGTGRLTLGTGLGPTEIRVLAGNTAIIDTQLASADTLLVTGGGTLELGGDNINTGGASVEDGVLRINRDANLGGTASSAARRVALVAGKGALHYHDAAALASQTMNRDLNLISAGSPVVDAVLDLDLLNAQNALRLTGDVSGDGGWSLTGQGHLVLLGDATHAGGTRIASTGGLQIGEGGMDGSLSGDVNVSTLLNYQRAGDVTQAGVISGGGVLRQSGPGTLILEALNSHAGGTEIMGGVVQVSQDGNLGAAAGGLTFNNNGTLRLAGGSILNTGRQVALGAGGGRFDVGTGRVLGLDGIVSGAGALRSIGAGRLVLSASNAYEGGTAISGGGTVAVGRDNSLGAVGGGVTLDNGVLAITDAAYAATGRNMIVADGHGVLDMESAGTTFTIGGVISGSGGLTAQGGRTLILTGHNLATGRLIVDNAGGLQLGAGGTTGIWQGGVALNTAKGMTLLHANNQTLTGVVSGVGKVEQKGSGIATLSGVNTYQGGTTISGGGTLRVTQDHNLGQNTGAVTFNNGTLNIQGTGFASTGRQLHLNSAVAGGNVVDIAAGATQFSGVIDGVGRLDKTGAGRMVLSASNTYQGGTRIAGGTVAVSRDNNLGAAGGGVTLDGGTLAITDAAYATTDRSIVLGSGHGVLDLENAATVFTANGLVSGLGDLTVQGDGKLILTKDNSAGQLIVDNAGGVQLGDGGTTGAWQGDIALNTAAGLSLLHTSSEFVSGVVSGIGKVEQKGSGIVTLSGVNTYEGGTVIGGGGTVRVTQDHNLGQDTGAVTFNNGALRIQGTGFTSTDRQLHLNSATAGGNVVDMAVGTTRFNGVIDGVGRLDKIGAGKMVLAGVNDYRGGTRVSGGGAVSISQNANLGRAGTTLSLDDATLEVTGTIAFATDRALELGVNHGRVAVAEAGQRVAWDGIVSGAGQLHKQGAGTLALSGANTYSGGTRISGIGALEIQGDGNLGKNDTLTAKTVTLEGGILVYRDANAGAAQTLDRRLVLNQTSTLMTDLANTQSNALILQDVSAGAGNQVTSGIGRLMVIGTGRVVLAGDAQHAGGTTVGNLGGLQVGDGGVLGSLAGDVINHTWLGFNRSGMHTFAGQITGAAGVVEQMAASTLVLDNDANSYGGGTRITGGGTIRAARNANLGAASGGLVLDDGTLALGSSDFTAMSRAISVGAGGGTLNLGATDVDLTVAGELSGMGALSLSGAGRVILTADNTAFGGQTIVSSSRGAQLGAGGAAGSVAGNVRVDTSLSYLHNTDQAYAGVISGAGSVTQAGSAVLTLSGSNSYEGGTTIRGGGTVAIANNANLGAASGSLTLLDNGRLRVTGGMMGASARALTLMAGDGRLEVAQAGHTLRWQAPISGTGALIKQGAGTLVLDQVNNYQGGTQVQAGVLSVAADSYLGATSGGVTLDGGTLAVTGASFTQTARALSLGSKGATLNVADAANTLRWDGMLSGAGALTLSGAGAVTLTAANANTGLLTVGNTGGLQLGNGGADGSVAGNLRVDTSLRFNHTTDQAYAGVLSGAGGVTQQGSGELRLSGDSSGFTGTTTVASGGVRLMDGAGLGGAVSVASAARLAGTGTVGASGRTVQLAGGATLAPGQNAALGTLTVAGDLDLADTTQLALRLGNPGSVPGWSGANDRLHVQGDLRLGGELRLSAAPAGQGTPGKGYYRLVTYDGVLTPGDFKVVNPPVIPGATSLTILTDTPKFVDLYVANDGIQHWKGGDGAWSATGTDWLNDSGATLVRWAGKTAVFADSSAADTGGAVTVGEALSAQGIQFVRSGYHLAGTGQLTLGTGLAPAEIRVLAGVEAQIDTRLAASDALLVNGGGTLVLGGTNVNSGGVQVADGTLRIRTDANLGSAATAAAREVTLQAGSATLQYHDAGAGATQDLNRDLTLDGDASARAVLDLNLAGDAANALRLTGNITGTGGLAVTGTGRLVLTGEATHAGGTHIANDGGVQVGEGGTSGSLAGDIVNDAWLGVNRSDALTLAGTISGSGALAQLGAGDLTLSGTNTYQGGTTVLDGAVVVRSEANLGDVAGALTLDGGALRIVDGNFVGTSRALAVGAGHGTVQVQDNETVTFSGAVSGAGDLSVTGNGGAAFTGVNTGHTGRTIVSASGGVQFGDGGADGLPGGDIVVQNTAVRVDLGTARTYAGRISGTGGVAQQGAGTLTLSGLNTYEGGTLVGPGSTVAVTREENLGAIAGSLTLEDGSLQVLGTDLGTTARALSLLGASGGRVEVAQAGHTLRWQGQVSGVGALIKQGTGTLALGQANSYQGGTQVLEGTLSVGSNSQLGAVAGEVTLDGGTLAVTGTAFGASARAMSLGAGGATLKVVEAGNTLRWDGVLSGSGALTLSGAGAVTLTAANANTGLLTVGNTGGLQLGNGGAEGSVDGDVQIDTALRFDHATDQAYAGVLSGAGTLTQQGSGVVTLSGDSSGFTGTTTVASGVLRVGDAAGQGALGGTLNVLNGATLSGRGAVGATGLTTTIGAGATLAPANSAGYLHVAGHLILDDAATTRLALGEPGPGRVVPGNSDLVSVAGNLRLAGELALMSNHDPDAGEPDLGYYRLMTYGGVLDEGPLTLNVAPDIQDAGSYKLLTDVNGVVDIYVVNDSLQHWRQGDGVWNNTEYNWYTFDSPTAMTWSAQSAVFDHDPGSAAATVTVEDDVSVQAMQFVHNGYRLNGDGRLLLAGKQGGMAELRVLPQVTTHIDTVLAGQTGLNKTQAGTAVLSGHNTYAGGTRISGGVLQIGADQHLGARATEQDRTLTLQGGTLRYQHEGTEPSRSLARRVVLNGAGTIEAALSGGDAVRSLVLTDTVSGSGQLSLSGSGRIVLAASASHTGGTVIANQGGLQVGQYGTQGSLSGNVHNTTGLDFARSDAYAFTGAILGAGAVRQLAEGTLRLSGQNTYEGGTQVLAGTLAVQSDANLGAADGELRLDGGTLAIAGTAFTHAQRALTIGAQGGTVTIEAAGHAVTLAGELGEADAALPSGALRVQGAGGLVLTADSPYRGTLTIANAGGVSLGDGGDAGSVAGPIQALAGTTLTFNRATDLTHAGRIAGAGGVIKDGAGTVTLTGENAYAGGTLVRGGVLAVSRPVNLGAADGSITLDGGAVRIEGAAITTLNRPLSVGQAGGMLEIAQAGHRVTVATAIGGAGGLRLQGAGEFLLTADNTYAGTTVVANAGGLSLGEGGTRGSLAGDVQVDSRLSFHRSDAVEYAGRITGAGRLVKLGDNLLTLTGDGAGFTGTTRIETGTLRVGRAGVGALGGEVQVESGATLGGSGTVGGAGTQVAVLAGGVVAPGNSVGTLNVAGHLSLAPGSFYDVEADDQGQADRLQVAGTASLSGTVRIEAQGANFAARTAYTILSAGERVGEFEGATANYEYLRPELAYAGNEVALTLVRKEDPKPDPKPERPFRDAAETPNQAAVADAIESMGRDSELYQHIETIPEGKAPQVLNVLSAALHANAQGAIMSAAQHVQARSLNHLRQNMFAAMLPGEPTASALSDLPPPASSLPRADTSPLWIDIVGAQRKLSGDSNGVSLDNRLTGFLIGGNIRLGSGWHAGASVAYTESSIRTEERLSKADAKSVSIALMGGKLIPLTHGKLSLMAGASYAHDMLKTRRDVADSGLSQVLNAKYRGNTVQLFGEASYAMQVAPDTTVSPFLNVILQQYRTNSYQETGGYAAVSGQSQSTRTMTSTLGVRGQKTFSSERWNGSVYGSLGWRHTAGDINPQSTLTFQGSKEFTVHGAPVARHAVALEVGAEVALSKKTSLGVSYGGQFGRGDKEHAGKLSLRVKF